MVSGKLLGLGCRCHALHMQTVLGDAAVSLLGPLPHLIFPPSFACFSTAQLASARLASLSVLLFTTTCGFFFYQVPGTPIAGIDDKLSLTLEVRRSRACDASVPNHWCRSCTAHSMWGHDGMPLSP